MWPVSNIYLTKPKWHTERNLHYFKNLENVCIVLEKWYKSRVASRSASADVRAKCRINRKKRIEFAHGGFLWNFFRKLRWTVATHFVGWKFSTKSSIFEWGRYFITLVVAMFGVNVTSPESCSLFFISPSSRVSFTSVCCSGFVKEKF